MSSPLKVGRTTIMHAGAHCSDIGKLVLSFIDKRLQKVTGQLISLDNTTIEEHPKTAALVKQLQAPFSPRAHEVIATARTPILRAQTIAGPEPRKRDAQSPADSLFADILRSETKSDVAFLPGVGYGVGIPAGPITVAALRNFIPHDSHVVTMDLTGGQLLEILSQALENTFAEDPRKKVGGMIQISGLEFWYRPQPAKVLRCNVGDRELAPQAVYRVATNSMLAAGGHRYRSFLDGKQSVEWISQFEMIKTWMIREGGVAVPTDDRIHSAPVLAR